MSDEWSLRWFAQLAPRRDKVSMANLDATVETFGLDGLRKDVREQYLKNKAAGFTGSLWDGPGSPFRRG